MPWDLDTSVLWKTTESWILYVLVCIQHTHVHKHIVYVYTKSDPYNIYCKLPGWALFFVVQRFPYDTERGRIWRNMGQWSQCTKTRTVSYWEDACWSVSLWNFLKFVATWMRDTSTATHFYTHISIRKYRINQMCLWHRRNLWCVFYFWWCELVFTLGHWILVGHLDDWITWA